MLQHISLLISGIIGYATGYGVLVASVLTSYLVDKRLGVAVAAMYLLNFVSREINERSAKALQEDYLSKFQSEVPVEIEEYLKKMKGKDNDTTIQ